MQEALEAVGLWPMKEYARWRQATINEYIDTLMIYVIFTGADQLQRSIHLIEGWDKDCIRAEGANGVSGEDEDEVE